MRSKTKRRVSAALIVADIIVCFIYLNAVGYLFGAGEASFKSSLSAVVYAVASECGSSFKEVVTIEKDGAGKVTYLGVDAVKANAISAAVADKTFKALSRRFDEGVTVPTGAFTGSSLLSGVGKKVNLKLLSVANVKCSFITRFSSAGINQTRSMLFLVVEPSVSIVTAAITKELNERIELLCYDALIVGDVPEIYLGG